MTSQGRLRKVCIGAVVVGTGLLLALGAAQPSHADVVTPEIVSAQIVAPQIAPQIMPQAGPTTVIVKFDANGGTVTQKQKSVSSGAKYGSLPVPKRTGYNFSGWYTDASAGTKITSASRVNAQGSQTLYAQWVAKNYTVTFNAQGGTVTPKSAIVTYDQSIGSLPAPTRSGYTFVGWYTKTSGGTQVVPDAQVKLTSAITLYARWSKVVRPPTNPSHWIDVDLTKQTLTMMDGNTAVKTFIISSGKKSTPTPTGTFHIYAQTADQSMGGYKHVKWCSWFYPNYALHTAYWHNSFGTPVSHGCVNLREADAKQVYDWISVGSTVVIHK